MVVVVVVVVVVVEVASCSCFNLSANCLGDHNVEVIFSSTKEILRTNLNFSLSDKVLSSATNHFCKVGVHTMELGVSLFMQCSYQIFLNVSFL